MGVVVISVAVFLILIKSTVESDDRIPLSATSINFSPIIEYRI